MTIASGQSGMPKDRLTVTCEIPNAIWYFDIMPVNGWIPPAYWIADGGISRLLAILIVTFFFNFRGEDVGKQSMRPNCSAQLIGEKCE